MFSQVNVTTSSNDTATDKVDKEDDVVRVTVNTNSTEADIEVEKEVVSEEEASVKTEAKKEEL